MSGQGRLLGRVCYSIRSFLRPTLSSSGLAHIIDTAPSRSLCVGGFRRYSDGSAGRNPLMDGFIQNSGRSDGDEGGAKAGVGEAGSSDIAMYTQDSDVMVVESMVLTRFFVVEMDELYSDDRIAKTTMKSIRISPKKLNVIAAFVRGLTVSEWEGGRKSQNRNED